MSGNDQARKRYNHFGFVVVTSLLLLASGAARAQNVIATGGVYGGPTPHQETCYVFNAGTSIIPFAAGARIVGENQSFPLTASSCANIDVTTGAAGPFHLLPGQMCFITIAGGLPGGDTNQPWGCSFTTMPPGAPISALYPNLRGVMDIRDSNGNVLINSNLR